MVKRGVRPVTVAITGNFDLLNQFMFRGLRQNERPETGEGSKFGYLSIAGIVVPLGGTAKYFNGDTSNQFIGSVGLGFSY